MNVLSRPKEPIQILRILIALCREAILGYQHAASAMRDPGLRALLERNAVEREEIARVLSYKLAELASNDEDAAPVSGLPELAAPASDDDPRPLLGICATGERATLQQFSFALGQSLPEDVHRVVRSQLGRVLSASAALQHARLSFHPIGR